MWNNSIQFIDRILSGATIPVQNRPMSNSNEGVHPIPQISFTPSAGAAKYTHCFSVEE